MYAKVNTKTLIAERTDIPQSLVGLQPESLSDLSWADESAGFKEVAFWPVVTESTPPLDDETQEYGPETLTANAATKRVTSTKTVVPLSAEKQTEKLATLKSNRLLSINDKCTKLLDALKTGYPDGEVLSWDQQVVEAKAIAANSAAAAPLLSAVAAARGYPLPALAARVLELATAYAAASGAVIGNRQKLEAEVRGAATLVDLHAIDVNAGWPEIGS